MLIRRDGRKPSRIISHSKRSHQVRPKQEIKNKMSRFRLILIIVVLAFIPTAANAQQQQALDYITWGTSAIDDLVTSHMDIFVADGLRFTNVLAALILTTKAIRWMLHGVSMWHAHFDLASVVEFLGKFATVLILLHYYNNPLPGVSISVHQIFSHTARNVAGTIDLTILNDFLSRCKDLVDNVQKPSALNLIGIIAYFSLLVNMALVEGVLFVITIFGFIAIGVGSLLGPLFIPLLLVPAFSGVFWRWVNSMTVYSFYQVVANAFVYVWCHVLVQFFQNTVNGDYSLGHWLYLFVPFVLLNLAFGWSLFRVPSLAAEYFGGIGLVGASLASTISGLIRALF